MLFIDIPDIGRKIQNAPQKGSCAMNMISCNADCVYQKDGYCDLNFIPEISGSAVCGCHYYKRENTENSEEEKNEQ